LYVSDKKPLATLADVARQIHRLDASFLNSSMISVAPNFSLLAAPEDPTQANDVKPEHIDVILNLARRHYDYVLLDVGHSLDAVSIRALDQVDMIFPVMQATLPYVRDGKRLLGIFRSLDYRKDKIHLIVNRYEKSSEIRLDDMKTAYGTGIFRTIPNHYTAAAASVNQGVPILKLAKGSPISKALQEFAHTLAGDASEESHGWFSRVLKYA
jgi:pilus assembly protein CpaE